MADYVGAFDQGTTSTRFMIFDHGGKVVAVDQKEHEQIFPEAGLGRARRQRDLDAHPGGDQGRAEQGRDPGVRSGRGRHHQPARDDGGVGEDDRQAGLQRDRLAGHPDRRDRATSSRRTAARIASGPSTGLPIATYFSGPKARWILDNVERHPREGRGRRAAVRQHRHVVHLEPDRRPRRRRPRHRRHQRQPHDADEPRDPRLGRRQPRGDRRTPGHAARRSVRRPRCTATRTGDLDGIPIAGDLGDQQAALFGQTCFSVGEAKNTYGTGNFMVLNTGNEPGPVEQRPDHRRRLQDRRPAGGVHARGLDRHHRLAGPVAARQPRADQDAPPRSRTWPRPSRTTAACTSCPPSPACSRRTGSSDARGVIAGLTRYVNKGHIARAMLEATAWQTREVVDAMNADSGVALTALKVDGGMVFNETAHAVPVRRARRARSSGRRWPRRPRSARPTRPASPSASGPRSRTCARTGARTRSGRPTMEQSEVDKEYGQWKKAVTRTFDWVD